MIHKILIFLICVACLIAIIFSATQFFSTSLPKETNVETIIEIQIETTAQTNPLPESIYENPEEAGEIVFEDIPINGAEMQ